jgi:hypothetical protein
MPLLLGIHLTLAAPAVSNLGQPSAEPISQGALLFDDRRITWPFTPLGRLGLSGQEFLNSGELLLRKRFARDDEKSKGGCYDAHPIKITNGVRLSMDLGKLQGWPGE